METSISELLLDVWEKARDVTLTQRCAIILSSVEPDYAIDHFRKMSVGSFDAKQIELYQQLFGNKLEGLSSCPKCEQVVEFDFYLTDLQVNCNNPPPKSLFLETQGYQINFRLPSILDIEAVSALESEQAAQLNLIKKCVVSIKKGYELIPFENISNELIELIDQAMGDADPQGNINLNLSCATCTHKWYTVFDISKFLWHALDKWAQQTLQEIHKLALAYGWSEADILAISPKRRKQYLSMVTT